MFSIGDTLLNNPSMNIVYVIKNEDKLIKISQLFSDIYPNINYIKIPAWDCLPYDTASPSARVTGERINSFIRLGSDVKPIQLILITINALLQKNVPFKDFPKSVWQIKEYSKIILFDFTKNIINSGYRRSGTVMDIGEFAIRGGIVDIFTPNYSFPLRIDLFGDEVESIKFFDPLTQISIKPINDVKILPISEILLNEENINLFKINYRNLFGINSLQDELVQLISQGERPIGLEHWATLFHKKLETLFEILDERYSFILDSSFDEYSKMRFDDISDYYKSRDITYQEAKINKNIANCYKPVPVDSIYLNEKLLKKHLINRAVLSISPFKNLNVKNNINGVNVPNFWLNRHINSADILKELINYIQKRIDTDYKIIIACRSEGSRKILAEQLNKYDLYNIDFGSSWSKKVLINNKIVSLFISNLEHGFQLEKIIVISETDIFGKIYSRKNKRKKLEIAMQEAEAFITGDYLVHIEYGVGRYNGLKAVEINNVKHDCLELSYFSEDKLLVPVQNINLLSKFGGKNTEARLDKLGSKTWINKKKKVKEKIKDVAETLVRTASSRKLGKAVKLFCNNDDYQNFVSKFQYYETEDQLETIKQVLKDINSEQPMDRLICGDVGFGKTEVAMRAAYIAAKSNSQVAVIAPTTILARQHYETFKNRFKGEGISIYHLSRLTNEKDKRNIIKDLKEGTIDIVIGTHALLSDKIAFKNLCLFVVDEEQRFGVAQKERLKNITHNAHILTLTATPIPRTLHMALSGIRDLSIIASAPDDRLPVRSFVVPFNDFNVKEGIQREIHRGGQVYCIVPRIKDIKEFYNKIKDLVDKVSISIVHSKLSGKVIEDTMMKFYEGKSNILIATSIVENGLDIPNANTIFIYKADMFGLGQLYQLKGRVGRSDKRAYAYYLLNNNKQISANAEKRLYAIQSLEGLGAGFSLAAHDLDIRGAGNLLGDEQSGQIKEVGINLYQQLLNEAVSDIKNKKHIINEFVPQINLQAPALIPENYLLDISLRLQLYRRLGNIKDYNEFESFAIELIDRFGPIPKELNYLIRVMKIKINCINAGIQRIDSGINGATFEFISEGYIDPEKFITWLHNYKRDLKVRPDQKIGLLYKWESIDERLDIIEDLTSEIVKLVIN